MRLKDISLSFVVNFLLGVAWATALIGAVSAFLSTFHNSFLFATFSFIIGAIPGIVAVLILEHFITGKEQIEELQKQTKLLKLLLEKTDNK